MYIFLPSSNLVAYRNIQCLVDILDDTILIQNGDRADTARREHVHNSEYGRIHGRSSDRIIRIIRFGIDICANTQGS
jgi:hypothetical protein